MAASADLLVDAFGRIHEAVHDAVEGLRPKELTERLDDDANSISWLIWHLTRVQDDHIAGVAGTEQVWTSQGWHERFGLPFPPSDIGYGHSSEDVAAARGLTRRMLLDYYDAVHDHTVEYVGGLSDADLERVVDRAWTPPVTLGARLVSVIADDLQHVGQASFVRGVLRRR
ncbi:mycothiol transferase [Wenjunlia tyrosinilytica]|uniref:DUF664 domain-containing protein n=1 Tax=Wenjunlia tyrosinilytica TaxID=1544741 RepID=A0A918E0Q0_9ACTN|nr:DUF664 domain-containing protein [Wenjunlia tyrosinilytica]GGO97890.1 hypothetical protein GCM10012280_60740 [Wenjunlia tyrosinilytica]